MTKARIAVFASGNGSNAEEIANYFKNNEHAEVGLLLTNDAAAYAIERAKRLEIPYHIFTRGSFLSSSEVVDVLQKAGVTHIVLAGFLWLIPTPLLGAFPNRIINIHPALLPKFGGKGMYGMHVHEAVKASGEIETGITVHLVNEKYDEGKILFQARCTVLASDSAEQIAANVNQLEYGHYSKEIEKWIRGN